MSVAVAIFVGWLARGWVDAILVRIGTRILTHGIGKRVVLETLAKGIDALTSKDTPQ